MKHSFQYLFLGTVFATIASFQGSWTSFWKQTSSASDAPAKDASVQWVSQNFDASTNKFLNKNMIPGHLSASYRYLMMAHYFSRADVALPGFSKYFKTASERERENADKLMNYINTRGGFLEFKDVPRPDLNRWIDGVDALAYALVMERTLNQELLTLVGMANTAQDPHTKHVVEDEFLAQKVKIIKELGDHLTVLEKMKGDSYGLGEYVFDGQI